MIRVLLCDDQEIVTEWIQMILSTVRDLTVVGMAHDGVQAVEMVAQHAQQTPVDVVLMDLDMPVMNGKEATIVIREKISAAELPIIALTANALATDMQICLDIGMNAYLTKPIVPNDLFSAIARATKRAPLK